MNNQKRNTWLFLGFMVLAAAANCLSRLLESEWAALIPYVITKGYNLEYFDPGRDCTREDMMTFLWRLAGQPEPKTTSSAFPDVVKGKYYYKAVLWGVEKGITSGYSSGEYAGKFGVGLACQREHMVTFLSRYAKKFMGE